MLQLFYTKFYTIIFSHNCCHNNYVELLWFRLVKIYNNKKKLKQMLLHNRRKWIQTSFHYKKKKLYKIHKILSHRASLYGKGILNLTTLSCGLSKVELN